MEGPYRGGGGGSPCKKDILYEVEWSMLGCPFYVRGFMLKVIESAVRVMQKIHVTWRAVAQRGESGGGGSCPQAPIEGGHQNHIPEKNDRFLEKIKKKCKNMTCK